MYILLIYVCIMCSLRLAAFISIVKRVEEQGSAYQSGFGPFCSKSYMGLASIRRFMSHCSFYNLLIYMWIGDLRIVVLYLYTWNWSFN